MDLFGGNKPKTGTPVPQPAQKPLTNVVVGDPAITPSRESNILDFIATVNRQLEDAIDKASKLKKMLGE